MAKNGYHLGYQTLALCLYEYRAGNDSEALIWGQRSLDYADNNPPRVALVHIVLSMVYVQTNDFEKARREWTSGQQMVNKRLPDGVRKISDLGTPRTGVWHDWTIAYLLLQEAAGKIGE